MTTKMTERDKKLLAILGFFLVIALFFVIVIKPLHVANTDMKYQINDNKIQIAEMQRKEAELIMARTDNLKHKEEFLQAQQDLYPILKSQEIDRLLTEKVVGHNLSAKRLQIDMPKESANVIGYGRTADDGSNPDKADGVWIARVGLEVAGSIGDMDALVDDLAQDMMGIQVESLRWESRDQGGVQQDTLSLQLKVLMSRQ